MTVRQVGIYEGKPVFDDDEFDSEVKCPNCGINAGEKDETHSGKFQFYFTCEACGYFWQEVAEPYGREER